MADDFGAGLAGFAGHYAGEGAWYDETGETRPYRIRMQLEMLSGGGVRQWFHHLFYREGDAVIEQTLIFTPKANGLFTLTLEGAPLTGHGYAGADTFHYDLFVPDNRVEVTHIRREAGVDVLGSSEKNADGNHIWCCLLYTSRCV